jgi:hypothetical protein
MSGSQFPAPGRRAPGSHRRPDQVRAAVRGGGTHGRQDRPTRLGPGTPGSAVRLGTACRTPPDVRCGAVPAQVAVSQLACPVNMSRIGTLTVTGRSQVGVNVGYARCSTTSQEAVADPGEPGAVLAGPDDDRVAAGGEPAGRCPGSAWSRAMSPGSARGPGSAAPPRGPDQHANDDGYAITVQAFLRATGLSQTR